MLRTGTHLTQAIRLVMLIAIVSATTIAVYAQIPQVSSTRICACAPSSKIWISPPVRPSSAPTSSSSSKRPPAR